MTARQRRAGRGDPRGARGVYTGRIPRRVRGGSPAALAGYELPMGLLGFPGMGWLFAGFSFTASILLLAGPAVDVGRDSARLLSLRAGPAEHDRMEGRARLDPGYTLVSTLCSTARNAAGESCSRAPPPGSPPPRARSTDPRQRRRRHDRAAARLLAFVPAVAGVGGSSVRYAYQTRIHARDRGPVPRHAHGPVKLFAWQEPQSPYPADALRVHSADVRALVVRAAAVDDPAAYGSTISTTALAFRLRVRPRRGGSSSSRRRHRLRPGRYMFIATHQGMFGGRDFAYLTWSDPASR